MNPERLPRDAACKQFFSYPDMTASLLRRMFTVWLHGVVFKRMGITQVVEEFHDLREVDAMLEERVVQWRGEMRSQFMREGQDYLAGATDAEALRRLTRAAYRAASLDEVLALVRQGGN